PRAPNPRPSPRHLRPRWPFFFFSSRRRHTRCLSDWSSDVCSSDLQRLLDFLDRLGREYEVIIGSNGSTDSTTALGVDLSRRFKRSEERRVGKECRSRGAGWRWRKKATSAHYAR